MNQRSMTTYVSQAATEVVDNRDTSSTRPGSYSDVYSGNRDHPINMNNRRPQPSNNATSVGNRTAHSSSINTSDPRHYDNPHQFHHEQKQQHQLRANSGRWLSRHEDNLYGGKVIAEGEEEEQYGDEDDRHGQSIVAPGQNQGWSPVTYNPSGKVLSHPPSQYHQGPFLRAAHGSPYRRDNGDEPRSIRNRMWPQEYHQEGNDEGNGMAKVEQDPHHHQRGNVTVDRGVRWSSVTPPHGYNQLYQDDSLSSTMMMNPDENGFDHQGNVVVVGGTGDETGVPSILASTQRGDQSLMDETRSGDEQAQPSCWQRCLCAATD